MAGLRLVPPGIQMLVANMNLHGANALNRLGRSVAIDVSRIAENPVLFHNQNGGAGLGW